MTPAPSKGLKRLYNAFFYSFHGIKACLRTEEAFRQEVVLAAVMLPLAFWLGDGPIEHSLLVGTVLLVLVVELVNTAIERVVDRISFERHELSKEAKDMGSAAVLLTLGLMVLTWIGILAPKFF